MGGPDRFPSCAVKRVLQQTDEWKARHQIRAGVEGTISQGVGLCGLRRSRYQSLTKTSLQHQLTGVAINRTRNDAHLTGTPRARTRTSHFAPPDRSDGAKEPGPNRPTASADPPGPFRLVRSRPGRCLGQPMAQPNAPPAAGRPFWPGVWVVTVLVAPVRPPVALLHGMAYAAPYETVLGTPT